MKRIIAVVLSFSLLLAGCGQVSQTSDIKEEVETEQETAEDQKISDDDGLGDVDLNFNLLSDENLLQYVEDSVYDNLEYSLDSEDYIIEDVSAVYVSKEYLDELAYNSQPNIYFGYTLDEIEAQFDGEKYIFTCDDNGNTIVTAYENYDGTYDQIVKNVAIGTGVILICVTVSVISGGLGAPAVSIVFAASAKTATTFALSSSLISGAASAAITGYKTKDVKQTVDAAALAASEGFKWGAITGAITGGVSETVSLVKAAKAVPTPRESELYVLEKYGGEEQVSYLAGEEVPKNTAGATRPDVVVRNSDGTIKAIEVKNYNLSSKSCRQELYKELERQVTSRVENLPAGSTQKIVLDTRNRELSAEIIENTVKNIQIRLADVYPNIPIDVL